MDIGTKAVTHPLIQARKQPHIAAFTVIVAPTPQHGVKLPDHCFYRFITLLAPGNLPDLPIKTPQ